MCAVLYPFIHVCLFGRSFLKGKYCECIAMVCLFILLQCKVYICVCVPLVCAHALKCLHIWCPMWVCLFLFLYLTHEEHAHKYDCVHQYSVCVNFAGGECTQFAHMVLYVHILVWMYSVMASWRVLMEHVGSVWAMLPMRRCVYM